MEHLLNGLLATVIPITVAECHPQDGRICSRVRSYINKSQIVSVRDHRHGAFIVMAVGPAIVVCESAAEVVSLIEGKAT